MTIEFDHYIARLYFPRLYADPRLFEDSPNLPRLFLQQVLQLDQERLQLIVQNGQFSITDHKGRPARTGGTGEYTFQGKRTRSEYMQDVTVTVDYLDVGTGLTSDQHRVAWQQQNLWTMNFNLQGFDAEKIMLDLPSIDELYEIVKERAVPTTIASLELENVPGGKFDLALAFLETRLRLLAERDSASFELYASRYLDASEKKALEKRLTRESSSSTLYIILGKN